MSTWLLWTDGVLSWVIFSMFPIHKYDIVPVCVIECTSTLFPPTPKLLLQWDEIGIQGPQEVALDVGTAVKWKPGT